MTFEQRWPEISRKLARLLIARRVPEPLRDDIIQETGIRLLRVWHRVDPNRGAWGLARTIAIHAIADGASNQGRYEVLELEELAETADTSDSEQAGIARFRLSSVRLALSHMSIADRRILLAELGAASPPSLARSAMKMARSRARQRLRVLVQKPGSWAGLPYIPLRGRLGTFQRSCLGSPSAHPQLVEGVAAAALALALTVTTPQIGNSFAEPRQLSDGQGDSRSLIVDRPLIAADRGYATEHGRRAQEDSVSQANAEPSTTEEDESHEGTTAKHVMQDAEHVKQDADQAKKDADQAGRDAEQMKKDAEQLKKDAEQLAEDLPP